MTTLRPSGSVAFRSIVRPRRLTKLNVSSGPPAMLRPVPADRERWVHFRPRTVLVVIGILVASFITLKILWISRHVLSWVFIALFFALALNPAVEKLEKRFGSRRGAATAVVFLTTIIVIALIGWLFIPTLVDQVDNFAHKVPDYLDDVTKGRGRLGFLQEKYHLVDKARKALHEGG